MKLQNDSALPQALKEQIDTLQQQVKNLEAANTPNAVSVSFQSGATNYGTHLYKIGDLVIGVVELNIPTISANGWQTWCKIGTPPRDRINGRISMSSGGPARDWLITSDGDFKAYLTSDDGNKTLNVPVAYVSK